MALITQEPLKKIKEVEVALLLNDELVKEINEYCRVANITRGIERNGEAKTTSQARQEFFITKCIERVLEQDRDEVERLKGQMGLDTTGEELTGESNPLVKNILGDDFSDLVSVLDEE